MSAGLIAKAVQTSGEFYDYLPLELAGDVYGSMPVVLDLETNEFHAPSTGASSGLGIPFNPATHVTEPEPLRSC